MDWIPDYLSNIETHEGGLRLMKVHLTHRPLGFPSFQPHTIENINDASALENYFI